jgi:hypothetical protein
MELAVEWCRSCQVSKVFNGETARLLQPPSSPLTLKADMLHPCSFRLRSDSKSARRPNGLLPCSEAHIVSRRDNAFKGCGGGIVFYDCLLEVALKSTHLMGLIPDPLLLLPLTQVPWCVVETFLFDNVILAGGQHGPQLAM